MVLDCTGDFRVYLFLPKRPFDDYAYQRDFLPQARIIFESLPDKPECTNAYLRDKHGFWRGAWNKEAGKYVQVVEELADMVRFCFV